MICFAGDGCRQEEIDPLWHALLQREWLLVVDEKESRLLCFHMVVLDDKKKVLIFSKSIECTCSISFLHDTCPMLVALFQLIVVWPFFFLAPCPRTEQPCSQGARRVKVSRSPQCTKFPITFSYAMPLNPKKVSSPNIHP